MFPTFSYSLATTETAEESRPKAPPFEGLSPTVSVSRLAWGALRGSWVALEALLGALVPTQEHVF